MKKNLWIQEIAVSIAKSAKEAQEGSKKYEQLSKWTVGNNPREFDLTTEKGRKKYFKFVYKKENPSYNADNIPEFINGFVKYAEDGESRTEVMFFENKDCSTHEKVYDNYPLHGEDNPYDYSPTGIWFRETAGWYVTDERIITIQHVTLDC